MLNNCNCHYGQCKLHYLYLGRFSYVLFDASQKYWYILIEFFFYKYFLVSELSSSLARLMFNKRALFVSPLCKRACQFITYIRWPPARLFVWSFYRGYNFCGFPPKRRRSISSTPFWNDPGPFPWHTPCRCDCCTRNIVCRPPLLLESTNTNIRVLSN